MELKNKLEELGLDVRKIDNVYICRTKSRNLIVVDYSYDELAEMNLYHLETYNTKTINGYEKQDHLLEALKNYLKE